MIKRNKNKATTKSFTFKSFCPRCEKVVTKKTGTNCRYCGYPENWK